jgi:hypothetical protein
MAQTQQKLTLDDAFKEAKALSEHDTPVKLRNAARSLCDAFKLFLGEIGGAIYGYDSFSNQTIKIRFAFIAQNLPELKEYNALAKKLDKLRHSTEHSDNYFPKKEELDALISKAESLFGKSRALMERLSSNNALIDLQAQRRLLVLFLDWLQEEVNGYTQSHKSFSGTEPPQEEVKRAWELIGLKRTINELGLDAINNYLPDVREAITEIDGLWSDLSSIMEDTAATD